MVVHLCNASAVCVDTDSNNSKIHYISCKINHDGDANVSQYFSTHKSTENEKVLQASFRGYPLIGKVIHNPSGYQGIVFQETICPSVEGQERNLHATNAFQLINYWNWDKAPTKNDAFLAALDWIDIAESLHSPVES